MNNSKIQRGFMCEISMHKYSSSNDFTIEILEAIHRSVNEEKGNMFICNCDCINNNFSIDLQAYEIPEIYSFEYSFKVGFFPYNKVNEYYSKLNKFNKVFMTVYVTQACQV